MTLVKLPIALLGVPIVVLVLLCGDVHSTTVAMLQTKHGVVILADSKQSSKTSNQSICTSDEIKKVYIVQRRFAVTALGNACVYVNPAAGYNINAAWVQDLENSLP